MEADPRHTELVLEQMKSSSATIVSTPGVDEAEEDEVEQNKPEGDQVKAYRSIAARLNCLFRYRPDAMCSVHECCREMCSPTHGSWRRLHRISKHLR